MHNKYLAAVWTLQLSTTLAVVSEAGFSYDALPPKAVFPGPWDSYNQAPANKSYIKATSVFSSEGDVSSAEVILDGASSTKKTSLVLGPGGIVTLAFEQNIAGRSVPLANSEN